MHITVIDGIMIQPRTDPLRNVCVA